MNIIEPKAELWIPENHIQHVTRCARVCYGKDAGNDEKLYNALKSSKHNSMFRHETHYIYIPLDNQTSLLSDNIDWFGQTIGFDYKYALSGDLLVVVNGNWVIDYPDVFEVFKKYEVTIEEFSKHLVNEYDDGIEDLTNMVRYTFCLTTQISTSRELNRVSPNNIAERSTRYVDESSGTICRPHWITKDIIKAWDDVVLREYHYDNNTYEGIMYLDEVASSFYIYSRLLGKGIKKEDARGVLPLDTATKVVYTYSLDEWRHIFNLRYYDKTGKAHPNCKVIMGLIKEEFNKIGIEI